MLVVSIYSPRCNASGFCAKIFGMKNKNAAKKILFAAAFALFAALEPFALPGVEVDIPDASGEYVYYRDYSFNRESYIGFLCYDEQTYEARWFAPATETLAEKNIDILFSVAQKNGRLDLTGERFVAPPSQEDVEVVNYIHDLIYELSGRRAKLQKSLLVDYAKSKVPFMQAGIAQADSYEQFGGPVQMLYDAAIPIFNLKKIVDYTGRDVFVVVTIGAIENNKDKTFAEFVPPTFAEKTFARREPRQFKSAQKESLSLRVEIGKDDSLVQSVQADKNWSLAGQSLWTLGDSAIVSMQTMGLPQDAALGQPKTGARFLRFFASSKNGAYCDWSALDIHAGASMVKISSRTYNPKTQKTITDIKTVRAAAQNLCGCLSLAVYTGDYQANRGYFDKIAKSYSCKME